MTNDVKIYICKYCGKEFSTSQKLGGHISRCKYNPQYNNIINNIKNTKLKKSNNIERILVCEYCGNEYSLMLSDSALAKGKYRKTCSDKCAKCLTASKSTKDRNKKISESINKFNAEHKKIKKYICDYCGKEFTRQGDRKSKTYCSYSCMLNGRSKKLSIAAKNNKLGGLNPDTTHKNYKRGYYKGIWCDSSWELAFVVYCIDHNIPIKRNYEYKEYIFEDKLYKFYPDFIVNNCDIIEIKGFITPKNKAKIEQIHDVVFIYKKEIQPYIDYVVNKYGVDYYNTLYEL